MKEDLALQNPESISDELFNSFDPEEELWLIGGSMNITQTASTNPTATPSGHDVSIDMEIDW